MNKTAVLIPHYNNPEGLAASLASIGQEEHVDVLMVDDGSRVNPINEELMRRSFKANGQLMYIYMPQNRGIEYALNTGLEYLHKKGYSYIARLDCGDLCLNNRFAVQQQFLEANPSVKLVGSNVAAVDLQGGHLYNLVVPETYEQLKRKMYLNCQVIHPSAMLNAEVLNTVGYYPDNYKYAEDYAYFFKIMKKYEIANIQQNLVQIEINPSGISATRRKKQVQSRLRIMADNFYFGFYPVYGILRSLLLYVMPTGLILALKKKLSK